MRTYSEDWREGKIEQQSCSGTGCTAQLRSRAPQSWEGAGRGWAWVLRRWECHD